MEDFQEDIVKNRIENTVQFWGVVEDNADPMNLGRVKVRCFHYHTDDVSEIPTDSLPWAVVLQPTNSSSISGIGDFSVIQNGSWVYGFFMDGRDAQYPVVTHTVPGIHRAEAPGVPSGTSSGFLNDQDYFSGDSKETNDTLAKNNSGITSDGDVVGYTNPATQGTGSLTAVGDINMILQPKDAGKFASMGLPTYSAAAAPNGYACKDGRGSLRFHYGTALAFEKLTKDFGKGKFYINSAYRTPAYNAKVGGAKSSMHMAGRAIDVNLRNIGTSKAALAAFGKAAVKCGFVGFGIYYNQGFIHIDTGTGRVWNGAKDKWFTDALKEAGWYQGKKGLSGISTTQGNGDDKNVDPTTTASTNNLNTTNGTQDYVRDRLKAEGYTDAQIAGVMGHLQTESSFNPNIKVVDTNGKISYGVAQWNGPRYEALQRFTGQQNPGIEGQTNFLIHELNSSHKNVGSNLRSASSVAEATRAFAPFEAYRGYQDPNSGSSKKRLENANKFYSGTAFPDAQVKGFNDPTNSLPTPEYRGEPSTHMNARGFNSQSNQKRILEKDNGRMTGFPAAGDVGTFGEPELQAAPQYPFNSVKSSRTGHMMEMDDTPGSERVNIEHNSGSGLELFADGSSVMRTKGNQFNMVNGDAYQGVNGKMFITAVNDMNVRSTADMTMQADGTMNVLMGNDGSMVVSGDYLVSVGEDLKFKAARIVFEASADIDILSHAKLNLEGRGGVTIKSDASVEVQAGATASIKSPTVYMDDVIRMSEGGSKDVKGADSADIGNPPARKVVEKDNLKNSANQRGTVTTQESYKHYSGGMV